MEVSLLRIASAGNLILGEGTKTMNNWRLIKPPNGKNDRLGLYSRSVAETSAKPPLLHTLSKFFAN